MKPLSLSLAMLLPLAGISLPAQVGPFGNTRSTPLDWRNMASWQYTATSDIHVDAKQYRINFRNTYIIKGDGSSSVQGNVQELKDQLTNYAIYAALETSAGTALASMPIASTAVSAWMSANPAVSWGDIEFTMLILAYQGFVTSENVYVRNYVFVVPVEGNYTINYKLRGDSPFKPSNTISLLGPNGTIMNETVVLGSDSDRAYNLHLLPGIYHTSVGLGSGSVNFYSAGSLNDVQLHDSTSRSWDTKDVSITIAGGGLTGLLPAPGASVTKSLPFQPKPNANLLDGSISYSNIRPGEVLISPPDDGFTQPDYNRFVTPYPAINMRYYQMWTRVAIGHEVGVSTYNGQYFNFTIGRDADQIIPKQWERMYIQSTYKGPSVVSYE